MATYTGRRQVDDPVSDELRALWDANDIAVLWESDNGDLPSGTGETPRLWPWRTMQPILKQTAEITLPSIIERRVLQLVNKSIRHNGADATSGLLNGAMQVLMPGEHARPHRHSMHALRFVIDGGGAETVVEGKSCLMEFGDLVVTPGGNWHEHINRGKTPTVWVDILDAAAQVALGVAAFQPGPIREPAGSIPDDAFASPGIVPVVESASQKAYSPIFRYSWEDVRRALARAPASPDGARRVRYVNPFDGNAILPTMDCYMWELQPGFATAPFRTSASTICVVVEGEGSTTCGDAEIRWAPRDVFTLPQHVWFSHVAATGPARLFVATNRELYRRLGMLEEQMGGEAAMFTNGNQA